MKKDSFVCCHFGRLCDGCARKNGVALNGKIEADVTYTSDVKGCSHPQETRGAFNFKRWGLRGSEGLGDSRKVVFTPERGFSANNGTLGEVGREFDPSGILGRSSDQFGTLPVGRQYDGMVGYFGPLARIGTQYGGTYLAQPHRKRPVSESPTAGGGAVTEATRSGLRGCSA